MPTLGKTDRTKCNILQTLVEALRKSRQIETAPQLPARAQQLRVCDKISNLRAIKASPPAGWSTRRKIEYFHWAKKVVDGCHDAGSEMTELFQETYLDGLGLVTV